MQNLTDVFHYGVVEDRDTDPLRLGRCKVRIIGLHTENKEELPTEDLPWAYAMGSPLSASMSGIGHAPVGPVEGTIVVVIFRDVYKQHPVIIGTLGGIPEELPEYETTVVTTSANEETTENERERIVTDSSGNPVTDSSGNPVTLEEPEEQQPTTQEESKPETKPPVRKPGGLKVSEEGKNISKDSEGLASLSADKRKVGTTKTKVDPSAPVHAYQDGGGVWTIGWGNTEYADGTRVKEGDVITKAEADKLFDTKHQEFADKVNRDLKVPVTQSQFDTLVDMSYNMGHAGLTKSKMWSSLNAGKYEEAAALIPSTRATIKGQPSKGLTNRRLAQQKNFLKDGIPSSDLSTVKKPVTTEKPEEKEDKTSNPAVRRNENKKVENVEGPPSKSQTTEDEREDVESEGFRDPNEKYPLEQFLEEPDTHRLARHEKIDETIVAMKEAAMARGVKYPFGKSWDQPPIPYNAMYPFNHVYVSESGHVQEFDDTEGNERIHTYHKSGTFEEIDVNGTLVRRIVGDAFEIFERNGNVLVRGKCNLTVEGSINIRCENNANIQVLGDCKTEVSGDMTTSVKGDYKLRAKTIKVEAYEGNIDVKAEAGNYHEDALEIHMNSGKAVKTDLKTPEEDATGESEFGTLDVPSRSNEYEGNYESDEEGDNTKFIEAMIENGVKKPFEIFGQEADGSEEKTPAAPKEPPTATTEQEDLGGGPFSANSKLSKNWKLGDVAKGRSGIPQDPKVVKNLQRVSTEVLDPIKEKYPNMIITNSWRSKEVNDSIGGSKTSDHLTGSAVDIQFAGFDRKQTYEAAIEIQKTLPDYDQLILEYAGDKTWIHISHRDPAQGGNRREVKTIDVYDRRNNRNNEFVHYPAKS
jgi:GH24 family phage-related lysozyme (muramidase)